MFNLQRLGALVLAISLAFSNAAPRPPYSDDDTELLLARLDANLFRPRREIIPMPNLPSLATRHLQKRSWKIDYLDEGWKLYFYTYEQYLTIQNAAAALEDFFMSIAEQAAGPWLHQTPLKAFSIQLGQLILDFKCDVIAIPWGFVEEFAERMVKSVQSGFTGAFEAILEHLVSGGMIFVKLRTAPGPAAPV